MGVNLRMPPNQLDHHLGPLNAPVLLVEYGDFECPYCAVAISVVTQLIKEYKTDICYVYRHFPLKGIHPDAEIAAYAAESAGKQDKFWEMLNLLFENQEHLSNEIVFVLARQIGLDMGQFTHDIQSYEVAEKVHNDARSGHESGVEHTPTFFINGVLFEGSTNYWPLREAIEESLRGMDSIQI